MGLGLSFQQKEILFRLKDNPCKAHDLINGYTHCNGYKTLKTLKNSGFISENNKLYSITDKGEKYIDDLKKSKNSSSLVEIIEKDLREILKVKDGK